jgi:hypothetical protein
MHALTSQSRHPRQEVAVDEPRIPPQDTREFMALWNSATADHLSHKLAGVLQDLARRLPELPPIDEPHAGALAPVLLRAFQVAAAPEGGVHAAVQFLAEYGGESG